MPVTRRIASPVGDLELVASERGLRTIRFLGARPGRVPRRDPSPILDRAEAQLRSYFAGERRSFRIPLDLGDQGTAFQREIWAGLQRIPWGRTLTYGELAAEVGRPRAARAVGQANRANPIPIVIPCHRVVARDGLGGYSGRSRAGRKRKTFLLELEGAI